MLHMKKASICTETPICLVLYRENIIATSRDHLLGRHHGCLSIDDEFAIIISIHNAVCEICIGPFVSIVGEDSVDGVTAFVAVPLRKEDAVHRLFEFRRIVILILNMHYHPDGGLPEDPSSIHNCNLDKHK